MFLAVRGYLFEEFTRFAEKVYGIHFVCALLFGKICAAAYVWTVNNANAIYARLIILIPTRKKNLNRSNFFTALEKISPSVKTCILFSREVELQKYSRSK